MLRRQFGLLFDQLGVAGTRVLVDRFVTPADLPRFPEQARPYRIKSGVLEVEARAIELFGPVEYDPFPEFNEVELGYYVDARMRPWVRRDGERTVIDWPSNSVYRVDAPARTP